MNGNENDLNKFKIVHELCFNITRDKNNSIEHLHNLKQVLETFPKHLFTPIEPMIFSCLFEFLSPKSPEKYSEDHLRIIVEVMTKVFDKIKVKKIHLFFNIYGFLLSQIYDSKEPNLVSKIHEEYKLSIIECMFSITNSLSWDIIPDVYTKQNVPKLSQMVYVLLAVAKHEKLRSLRVSAIKCLMCLSRVHNDDEMCDLEIKDKIADVFVFFLPKIAVALKDVATEDEKAGHKVITIAIKAWSRIVALLMHDYKSSDEKLDISSISIKDNKFETKNDIKWKSIEDINDYLNKTTRTIDWYKTTDLKLCKVVESFVKLTNYDHPKIKLELVEACRLLIDNCANTLPKSLSNLIEIVIILSEDDEENVSVIAKDIVNNLSNRLSDNLFKALLENSEENFYNNITKLPRIFNSFDDGLQCRSLHLLTGYLGLFGKHKLVHVFHSVTYLNHLLRSLIHICELNKKEISVLEEFSTTDLEVNVQISIQDYKKFRYFRNDVVLTKLINAIKILGQQMDTIEICVDFLLNVYYHEFEFKKEATFILNELLSNNYFENECDFERQKELIKNVIYAYLETSNWNLRITTEEDDEYDNCCSLGEVQNNLLQICLQLEGIGKMGCTYGIEFRDVFLLKALYPILERAGCGIPCLKDAGLQAIVNVSKACGYKDVVELINNNSDYFSFHVVRKLKTIERNNGVLNVFSIVLKCSDICVLPSISDIIDGLLMDSCDLLYDKNPNSFLRVFQIFVKCLMRWLNVSPRILTIKSKKDKLSEMEDFKVSNVDYNNSNKFSDAIMDKTAEEMYEEDMLKSEKDIEDELNPEFEECKKPEVPTHIRLMVSILRKTLNYLPSKLKSTKLLALDILKNGLEIIRDFENELLPLVHLIWSPLVCRFKETKEPLIINLSFQLLVTMGRLSGDFIRSRTSKDVLPSLLELLSNLTKESYLKDRGSAYRYSQTFKLQEIILSDLGKVLADLDVSNEDFKKSIEIVVMYLNAKQPQPLQDNALGFFECIKKYDQDFMLEIIKYIEETHGKNKDFVKNIEMLKSLV